MDKRKIKKILIGDFTIIRLFYSLTFIYVCVVLFAYFYSDRMIFFPRKPSYEHSSGIIKIHSENGVEISALYLSSPNSEFTILFSHGNAEDLGDIRDFLGIMQIKGYSVFAYDYQGYGTSSGRPSEKNAYKDIDAAYEYLVKQLNVSADRIIAHGRSVGGAVAIDLSSRRKLAGLIVESSFVSAFRAVTRIRVTPFDKFNNIDKIKKVKCPVLMIHGKDDRIIGLWHSEKLFEAANKPKLKFWVDGAGHNNLLSKAGIRYWGIIEEFTDMILTKDISE